MTFQDLVLMILRTPLTEIKLHPIEWALAKDSKLLARTLLISQDQEATISIFLNKDLSSQSQESKSLKSEKINLDQDTMMQIAQ